MQNIKAIIFDLGGVLLNIDFKKVSDAFKALGVDNFDDLYSQSEASPLFENLETGKINQAEFCRLLLKNTDKPIAYNDVILAWNAILLDFREESLAFMEKLKSRYKLFLLSNTNSIHYQAFTKIFQRGVRKGSFESIFEKVYYSHETGLRKPAAAAYLQVLKENDLLPQETLFIDDTFKNIEAATALQMPVIFLEKGMKIEDLGL